MTTRENLRPIQVRQSVFEAVQEWRFRQELAARSNLERGDYRPAEEVLQSLPRREQAIPLDE